MLRDFQEHISAKFKIPSSLWTFKKTGLSMVKPRNRNRYYPEYCNCINSHALKNGEALLQQCFDDAEESHPQVRLALGFTK